MTGLISRNRLFTVVLIAAALLRIDAELGYRWQSWFNDSWDYMDTAVTLNLDPTRTSGYGLYLFLLKPFHSLALVTISQHVMGLAVAVMMYALAKRRFRAPSWLAVLVTLPVLFDGFEIQLEHLILSDTLFLFLVMLAITMLLWSPLRATRSTWVRCAVAGALIGVSALVRSTGVPLLPLVGLWVLLALAMNRVGWRALIASIAAFAVTALAPSIGYAGWYDLQHGQFNSSESLGVFLYSRVMTFAECSKTGSCRRTCWRCAPRSRRTSGRSPRPISGPRSARWTGSRHPSSRRCPTAWACSSRSARSRPSRLTTCA